MTRRRRQELTVRSILRAFAFYVRSTVTSRSLAREITSTRAGGAVVGLSLVRDTTVSRLHVGAVYDEAGARTRP